MKEDSIEGIYETLQQCAMISKYAGGIGINISKVRGANAYISGTNGYSNGIIPMLRVFNATAKYVDQGGGKRKGSIATYLEPHHPDIMDFLELRKNNGAEEMRARDIFLSLWISDLFMQRVEADGQWSLFCPHSCPGLNDVYGLEYTLLYESYEKQGRALKILRARTVWDAILAAQIETGTPYMLFKDACNNKSNQKNLGTIKSSNLCTEIIEYTSPDEIAVCNLASISLPSCLQDGKFQFKHLEGLVEHAIENLNKVIDITFYPVPEAKRSNFRHRPLGLGYQGLATTFFELGIAYDSDEAKQLNRDIMETMYFAALRASCRLAQRDGMYDTFKGSPASNGTLQFDLWDHDPGCDRYDWISLKREIKAYGLRNSLLLCLMPTASTSQMFGNTPSCEPQMSNMFTRRTLSGDFVMANRYLVEDLIRLGLWTSDMKYEIMRHKGSVQAIVAIPEEIRARYKTAYEISGKVQCLMSRDRARFICQSESFNAFTTDTSQLTSRHFYAWRLGLKTGMYYLRTVAASDAIQFTVPIKERECKIEDTECLTCNS
jgi:ribonucleoside-diphosphate reductase alpha chain